MKAKILIAAFALFLFSCAADKLDIAKARDTAEKCLTAIDKEDYAAVVNDYYSKELNGSQTQEELSAKFKKLKDVTGPMQSFELKSSDNSVEPLKESSCTLTYVVKHERITTNEKFTIIEEDGKYRISQHEIRND